MSIQSMGSADRGDGWLEVLAASGVVTSLAASAASLLREDPDAVLGDRMTGALEAMRDRVHAMVAQLSDDDLKNLLDERSYTAEPNSIMAQLSSIRENPETSNEVQAVRDQAQSLLNGLEVLLSEPTQDSAGQVEAFLKELNLAESKAIQRISKDSEANSDPVFVSVSR